MENFSNWNVDKIKSSLQGGLIFSAYLYAIGFLVVNSYFGLYGIFPETFISARYLSAALLLIFCTLVFLFGLQWLGFKDGSCDLKRYPLAIFLIYGIWVYLFRAHAFKEIFFTSPILLLTLNLAIVLLGVVPYFYLRHKERTRHSTLYLLHVIFTSVFLEPAFFWFIFSNCVCAYEVNRFFGRSLAREGSGSVSAKTPLTLWVLPLILILTNIIGFGAVIYPVVPPYLGGGKPATVNLLLIDSERDAVNLGVTVQKDGWSEDLRLLFKGSQAIYIKRDHPTKYACTEIRGDAIKAIRYTGDYRLTLAEMTNYLFKHRTSEQ